MSESDKRRRRFNGRGPGIVDGTSLSLTAAQQALPLRYKVGRTIDSSAGEKAKSDEELLKDNAEFGSGEPGVAPEVCDHLASKKISMVGSDTWGLEPYDFAKSGAPESFAYCHMNLIVRRGIYNFENLDLDKLYADKAYEFLFAWAPIKLVGATGSHGNPVAAY